MKIFRCVAFVAAFVLSGVTLSAQSQPSAPMGTVTTAASARGWRDYEAKTEFVPGDRVWLYAEALSSTRNRRVNLEFHFRVLGPDGRSVYEKTVDFDEETGASSWAAWQMFVLSPRAVLGVYTLRVDIVNRITRAQGSKTSTFTVVSAATSLPSRAPAASSGEDDADAMGPSAGPLSLEMEEAFGLLRRRQYEESVRAFKRALRTEANSAPGYLGLARAYDGLSAYKNVIDSCDKLIACTQDPVFHALAHNMKGTALFTKATDRQPPEKKVLAEAELEFRRVLELNPKTTMARYNLGVTLLKMENDAAGIEMLRSYLAAAPSGSAAKDAERMIANPRRARENYAPDFTLVTMDGEYLDLEELRGKVVLLDFWATWCAPCRMVIPDLRLMRKKFADAPLVIISVSLDSNPDAWRSMVARERMEWHHYRDEGGRIARLFGVRPIPTTLVIDGEGIIRKRTTGYTTSFAATLEEQIRKTLKTLPKTGEKKGSAD